MWNGNKHWFLIFSLAIIIIVLAKSANQNPLTMKLTSSAFEPNGLIPAKYTCDGANINPPLKITGVPAAAQSLVLIVDDPDAPSGVWAHWVKYDLSPTLIEINEGQEPAGVAALGSGGALIYQGPCPPSGTHRYFFKLYALDTILTPAGAIDGPAPDVTAIQRMMSGHILEQTELIGRYQRN